MADHPPSNRRCNKVTKSMGDRSAPKRKSDTVFFAVTGGLSSCYVLLVLLLLIADVRFVSPSAFLEAVAKPEIRSSIELTLLTCTTAAILSLWVATPLGYLLSRFEFRGRWIIEALVDIPMVLPPLVLGLSLLILFHQPLSLFGAGSSSLEEWIRQTMGIGVTHHWPAIVLAQFTVASAFAVRTMRVAFDQIDPRGEDIARTLGCTRGQAFLRIAMPQASRGLVAATAIAWARSLGEFGPILVFAGATRMRTEVLSTSVFLELSVGQLDAAVAVSLLMVAMATAVLLVLRLAGTKLSR